MQKIVIVETARLEAGPVFSLARRGDEWLVRVDNLLLMSSRTHASEDSLAEHALERVTKPGHVLVGGLGLGYTLRAVLDRVVPSARVTVTELVPALVDWNRKHVGALAGHPLDDPRTEIIVGDVFDVLQRSRTSFDVILLDVDNGPIALSHAGNRRLYDARGAATCQRALRPDGVLAVWATSPNARYEQVLRDAGFLVETRRVSAFQRGSSAHVLFLATTAPPRAARRGSSTPTSPRRVVAKPRGHHRS